MGSGGLGGTSSALTCSGKATSKSSPPTTSGTRRRWRTCSSTTRCWAGSPRTLMSATARSLSAARSCCSSPNAIPRTCPGATSVSTSCSSRRGSSPTARVPPRTSRPAPVPDGSVVDLVVLVSRETSEDEVNELFRAAAERGPLEDLLQYSDEPLVSQDIVGSPLSCTFDSGLTMVNGRMVKVFGWYDNEWGYSCRLVDLVSKMGASLPKAQAAATA